MDGLLVGVDLGVVLQGGGDPLQGLADVGRGVGGEAVVVPLALLAALDEARGVEEGQVFGDRGGGEGEDVDDLAEAQLAGAEHHEGSGAAGVGDGTGGEVELVHGASLCHFAI